MGLARIAPTAAPSASESSSESRLRLVWGRGVLFMDSSLHVPYFGRAEKEYRNRRVVRLQMLGLGCRPSRTARLPRYSPRVLNRAEALALHGYRCRVFNRLDGHTARRVERLNRPAGLTGAVGRNVSKYVADLPARAVSLSAGCRRSFGPDLPARVHTAKRLEHNTLYALLVTSGDQAF